MCVQNLKNGFRWEDYTWHKWKTTSLVHPCPITHQSYVNELVYSHTRNIHIVGYYIVYTYLTYNVRRNLFCVCVTTKGHINSSVKNIH